MNDSSAMLQYHDKEWGVPVHNDRTLFEFLILEGAQAGLNWQTVLNKRENYRKAFDRFDPAKIAKYDNGDVRRLLADPGIIRNRLKIKAAITDAKEFLKLKKESALLTSTLGGMLAGSRSSMHSDPLARFPQ